MQADEKETL